MHLRHISAVRIFAHNFEETTEFYEKTLQLDAAVCGPDVTVFRTGQCQLILEKADEKDAEEASYVGRFSGISFDVENCREAHAALTAKGVPFEGPPIVEDWGGVLAHFRDPAGNVLSLVEHP